MTKERHIHELYRDDPERADALVFGRRTGVSRRGFLGSAGLVGMTAAVGGAIPFAGNMPAGLIPAAMAQTAETGETVFHATRAPLDDPWVELARESLQATSGRAPAVLPNLGGSLPNEVFAEILGLPTVWVPQSYGGCNQHAPDEHLPLSLMRDSLRLMTGLFWDAGARAR